MVLLCVRFFAVYFGVSWIETVFLVAVVFLIRVYGCSVYLGGQGFLHEEGICDQFLNVRGICGKGFCGERLLM